MTDYVTVADTDVLPRDGTIKLHGPAGFAGMRAAGRLAAEILDALAALVKPGVTTAALDDVVRQMTLDGGAVPARAAWTTSGASWNSRPTPWPQNSRTTP